MQIVIKKSAFDDVMDILEKANGKRDMSKNHWEVVTDINGVRRKVLKRNAQPELASYYRKRNITLNSPLFKANLVQGFRNGEEGLQPETDIDAIYKLAEKDHSHLVNNVNKVGKMLNLPDTLIVTRPSLKKQVRAKEKLMEDYNSEISKKGKSNIYDPKTDTYNASTLRDIDGATLAFNSMADLTKALAYYNSQDDIIRIKNNFQKVSPLGYSDINMNIRLPNGSVSEIQLNTVANIVAKEGYGHALYEVSRDPSINTNPKYTELVRICQEAQKNLYGAARDFSMKENFPQADLGKNSPFGYKNANGDFVHIKNKRYDSVVKPYVAKAMSMVQAAYKAGDMKKDTYNHFMDLAKFIK